jgi:hypothetical protein
VAGAGRSYMPTCECGTHLTDLRTFGEQLRWAERLGVSWDWKENGRATLDKVCLRAGWPCASVLPQLIGSVVGRLDVRLPVWWDYKRQQFWNFQ